MSSISAGTTSTTTLVHSGDTTGSLVFKTNDTGSGGTTAVTIDTSQNVLVGQTTNTNNVRFALAGSGGTANDFMINSNSSYSEIQSFNAKPLYLNRQGNNVIVCSGGDNLLVGTTSQTPGYGNTNTGVQLSNNGSHFSRGATDWVMTVNQNTADGSARYLIGFRVSNNQVGNIQSNGTNCTYNSNSDYRLKENVRPMQNALGKVARLNPVTYKWKLDGSDGEGFIAHELAEVVPECVTGKKDAVDADGNPVYQGVDTSFLVATLTAALQETKALIDQQAETINALTARLVALEGQ